MADTKVKITVDDRQVIQAFQELGPAAFRHLLDATKWTATLIQAEAQMRVARRTGQTAAAVTMKPVTGRRAGYRVFVGRTEHPKALTAWLEWGTRNMSARPFLFASARLEEGPHQRRVEEALQTAIAEASR